MSKEEGDGHSHTTSNDIQGGDMVADKPPETEARSGPKEHGESNAEYHAKRQDQKRGGKIKNESEGCHRESPVHQRPVGRTSRLDEEHQVGKKNNGVASKRGEESERKTEEEVAR